MKALILNSGLGSRMGALTKEQPKCMTKLGSGETILSRQLRQLRENAVTDIVMTTGAFREVLTGYVKEISEGLNITLVHNPLFKETNYIYSMYLAGECLRSDDLLLLHGDLVLADRILPGLMSQEGSAMTVSSLLPLPEKDFKAVLRGGKIVKIGVEFFADAVAAQPLYLLRQDLWSEWLESIITYVEEHNQKICYAENAFNEIGQRLNLYPYDVKDLLCSEIDNEGDLERVSAVLREKG